jgi:hypothetical protein
MKVTRKLTLLVMAFAMVGCNEQVSPKLQDANSSTVVPPTVTPSEYYLKVTNTSPAIQNYILHRSGFGNANTPCEVRKSIPLTNDIYRSGDVDSDITCYFEAEELSLSHGGFSIEFESSPNTCEYVGYTPFSFYNRIPGSSTSTLNQVVCETDNVTAAHISGEFNTRGEDKDGAIDCNEFVDNDFTSTVRKSFITENDAELCRFNYQDGDKEMCDEGTIQVNELRISYSVDDGVKSYEAKRTIRCGGKHYNCIKGPIHQEEDEDAKKMSSLIEIYQTEKNQTYVEKREYKGILEEAENYFYANHRRHLSNVLIDFEDPTSFFYADAFTGASNYQSLLMENYSKNLKMDGSKIIDDTTWDNASIVYSGADPMYHARPYASDPFMAMKGEMRTSPFYTVQCLDRAFETKARIRIVVRDWDRVKSGDSSKRELISDINEGYDARQDNTYFLDMEDWDEQIPMRRTAGAYNAATTIWEPHSGTVSLFFSDEIFPNIQRKE